MMWSSSCCCVLMSVILSSPLSPSPSGEGERLTERPPRSMKHPEGRITAQIRSDRLLGCSPTATGAGDTGRNTPTRVLEWPKPALRARLSPNTTQHGRDGGVTNHFSPRPFRIFGGFCEQSKKWYQAGQGEESRRATFRLHAACWAARSPWFVSAS